MKKILLLLVLTLIACSTDERILRLELEILEQAKEIELRDNIINGLRYDLLIEQEKINILICESNFNHNIKCGDKGISCGIAQFQEKTFIYLKNLADMKHLKWHSVRDQLILLDWALRNGYAKYWTCYSRQNLTKKEVKK